MLNLNQQTLLIVPVPPPLTPNPTHSKHRTPLAVFYDLRKGTLLGQKDLKFLRNMYIVFFFTVPAYMLRLKHRSLTGVQIVGIETMWTAFAMYNVIRSSSFHLRLAQLQRRTERGAEVALDDVEPRE